MTTIVNHYVKFGIAGYGPDLDFDDEPYDDVASLCEAIRYELDTSIDMLADEWADAAANCDGQAYMDARELADVLDQLRANLDYARRMEAPLYRDDRDALDATMLAIIEEHFPMDTSTNGAHRLYVWEAMD